ncbi:MAG TPA: TIGR00645 family protein [Roseiarcus sp.]|nr:TIGR00645 family protein [Roseiarcus sp.]
MINRALANILLGSRWLLAAFYLALVVGLVELLVKTGQRVYELCLGFFNLTESGMILGALSIIDQTLTASLVLIVIFSGYANFVSPIDPSEHADWPRWMTNIDFGELKLKLMASIVAITAVKLLEAYMDVDQTSDRDLWWLAGLHVTFVVSTLLMALTDRIGQRRDNRAS